jgi:uncharacterized ParB-like nuclease family protein
LPRSDTRKSLNFKAAGCHRSQAAGQVGKERPNPSACILDQ